MNNQYYQPYNSTPYYGGAGPMQPAVYPQSQGAQVPKTGTMPMGGTFPPAGAMPMGGTFPPAGTMPISGTFPPAGTGPTFPTAPGVPGMLPVEQSYIENILRLNKGKLVTVFATFENNTEWNAKRWVGIIEAAGRDHLILSQTETGQRLLLPMVYLDYILFDEEIEYSPEFGGVPLTTYSPR